MVILRNIRSQYFLLPQPITNYICKIAGPTVFKKLRQTCKFFFAKYVQRNPCPWMRLKNYKFWDKGTRWLIGRLEMQNVAASFYQSFILKINGCNLNCLVILNSENLTFNEFKFFTASREILLFHLIDTKIMYPDNTVVPVEDIINCVLNAQSIDLQPCHVTPETMVKLCSTARKTILKHFRLHQVDGNLDPELFVQFLKNNFKIKEGPIAFEVGFKQINRNFYPKIREHGISSS